VSELPIHCEQYLVADGNAEGAGTFCYETADGEYMLQLVNPSLNCRIFPANNMWEGLGGEEMSVEAEIQRWVDKFDAQLKDC